ncbi:MAG: hypothetical protein J7K66_00835, partial [Anaerolineaceae bacterium]|nr:hypothetical protein [Anaerolineaceae bacterium]
MIQAIRKYFALKLLAAFILVTILSGLILATVMNISIESIYYKHIGKIMANEGLQKGGQIGNKGGSLYENFKAAVNESLLISSIAAFM